MQHLQLYALGSNKNGQLGIHSTADVCIPTKCVFSPPLTHPDVESTSNIESTDTCIAAGGNHTLFLHVPTGILYAAGSNEFGQCGCLRATTSTTKDNDAEPANTTIFRHVAFEDEQAHEMVQTFRLCAATWDGSIVVAERRGRDQVWCFGGEYRDAGELCRPLLLPCTPASSKPARIPNFPPLGRKVVKLAAGLNHVVALLDDSTAWGWGSNAKGQLGVGDKNVRSPRPLDVDGDVVDVACGRDFTAFLTRSVQGTSSVQVRGKRFENQEIDVAQLHAHSRIFATWKDIYMLPNMQSQVVVISKRAPCPPFLAPHATRLIRLFRAGSDHVVALTEDGTVVLAGWSEHGNCGPRPRLDVDANANYETNVRRSRLTARNARVVGIGAGCATSFLAVLHGSATETDWNWESL